MRLFIIFLLFCFYFDFSESVYRVRKLLRQSGNRRSIAENDDALDLEAAELVFKEKGLNKLPYGNTMNNAEAKKVINDGIGAPDSTTMTDKLMNSMRPLLTIQTTTPISQTTVEVLDLENVEGQESEWTSTTRVPFERQTIGPNGETPFDFNIDPDFARSAPFARGLVGIPEGWNNDKQIDEEFRKGFRSSNFRRHFRFNK